MKQLHTCLCSNSAVSLDESQKGQEIDFCSLSTIQSWPDVLLTSLFSPSDLSPNLSKCVNRPVDILFGTSTLQTLP